MSAGGKGFSNTVVSIKAITRRIEQGLVYSAIRQGSIDAGNNLDLLIRIGGSPTELHFIAFAEAPASLSFYESPTITGDGTGIDKISRRRIPPIRPAETGLFAQPIVTDTGTELIPPISFGGTAQGNQTEGGQDDLNGWLLAPNVDYLLRLTNDHSQAQNLRFELGVIELIGPLSSGM